MRRKPTSPPAWKCSTVMTRCWQTKCWFLGRRYPVQPSSTGAFRFHFLFLRVLCVEPMLLGPSYYLFTVVSFSRSKIKSDVHTWRIIITCTSVHSFIPKSEYLHTGLHISLNISILGLTWFTMPMKICAVTLTLYCLLWAVDSDIVILCSCPNPDAPCHSNICKAVACQHRRVLWCWTA